jgi:glucan phosphoethanolaminetransferase (alkaline phosphatase superfamily)
MKEQALKGFFGFRKVLVYGKVWAQRTMSWIAVLNSAMILFLVLAKLQEYGIGISITRWFIPIFILLVILMIFFGYLEDKAGFHREELQEITKRNPVYNEILERLERIEKRLEKR